MSARGTLVLFLASLAILAIVAAFQGSPGYMDAEYYFIGGQQLARGSGFSEPFLWNYLDDPAGIPHPSHTYWMPLASILAFLPLKLGGSLDYGTGRMGFILLAACLAPLTAHLAYRYLPRRDAAWLAGLLALFPGFYLAYLPTTDTFGIVMLLGGLWMLAAIRPWVISGVYSTNFTPFILGLISGFMHLARADGLLWLALSLVAGLFHRGSELHRRSGSWLWWLAACSLGYAVVIGPWLVRNHIALGSAFSPASSKALWFTAYNDLYIYPHSVITAQRWLESGLGNILNIRISALGQNLVSAVVVQGVVFLVPLILLGLRRLRTVPGVRLGLAAWLIILAVMSFVFPFAGSRGGFFHSAAALQPMFWAAVPAGLDAFVQFGSRRRGWNENHACRFFQVGLVILAVLISWLALQRRVVGSDWRAPIWDLPAHEQASNVRLLAEAAAEPGQVIMINNPPGYYLASGDPAIAIPDGDIHTLLDAGRRYGARYVILEANHPPGLSDLYTHPRSVPGLQYLASSRNAHLFEITPDTGGGDGS